MKRDNSIDLFKGLGMIFVVVGHAGAQMGVFSYIYTFHMPLFAFVSGLFLNPNCSFGFYVRHKANRLLVPFFLWSILFWFFYGLLIYFTQSDMLEAHLKQLLYIGAGSGQNSIHNIANVTLWFLPFLFSSAIIHFVVNLIKNKLLQVIAVIVVSLLGCVSAWIGKPLPYSIDTAFALYPFLYFGSCYSLYIKPILDVINGVKTGLFIIALVMLHFCAYLWEYVVNNVVVDTASNDIGNYFLFYIGAFAAVGYWMMICNKIQIIKPINYIGRNAIIVLIFHYPILQIIRATFMPYLFFLRDYGLYGWVQTTICLLLCVPIIYVINGYMKWSIGTWELFNTLKK